MTLLDPNPFVCQICLYYRPLGSEKTDCLQTSRSPCSSLFDHAYHNNFSFHVGFLLFCFNFGRFWSLVSGWSSGASLGLPLQLPPHLSLFFQFLFLTRHVCCENLDLQLDLDLSLMHTCAEKTGNFPTLLCSLRDVLWSTSNKKPKFMPFQKSLPVSGNCATQGNLRLFIIFLFFLDSRSLCKCVWCNRHFGRRQTKFLVCTSAHL